MKTNWFEALKEKANAVLGTKFTADTTEAEAEHALTSIEDAVQDPGDLDPDGLNQQVDGDIDAQKGDEAAQANAETELDAIASLQSDVAELQASFETLNTTLTELSTQFQATNNSVEASFVKLSEVLGQSLESIAKQLTAFTQVATNEQSQANQSIEALAKKVNQSVIGPSGGNSPKAEQFEMNNEEDESKVKKGANGNIIISVPALDRLVN